MITNPKGLNCFSEAKNIFSNIYSRVLSSTRPYQALTLIKNKQNDFSDKTFTFLQIYLLPFNSAKNWFIGTAGLPIPGTQVIENRLLAWKWKERKPKIFPEMQRVHLQFSVNASFGAVSSGRFENLRRCADVSGVCVCVALLYILVTNAHCSVALRHFQ